MLRSLRHAATSLLGQNVISNYVAVFWLGGLSLALVPFYLKWLGAQQWGLVAVCMALQALWGVLDAGLSQIMPRDVARQGATGQARVYRIYARAYWLLGMTGFALGQILVPWLVTHWFNRGSGLDPWAELALRLVLVQFLFQFANSANVGYWLGREKQKLANIRQCIFGTLKHAGAVALILGWRADALAYLLPFVLGSVLEWWSNRYAVSRLLVEDPDFRVKIRDLRALMGEAGTLAVGVLAGMLVVQIDRIVLSSVVDIEAFGRYVVVANLGLALMQLQSPLTRAFLPRLVGAVATDRRRTRVQLGGAVLGLCVLPSVLAAIFAPFILDLWLGDRVIVVEGATTLRLIALAVAVNSIFSVIYLEIITRAKSGVILAINVVSLVVVFPVTFLLSEWIGVTAGGVAWMMIATLQLGLGGWWFIRMKKG